jgi:nudix-type nucleoside diphosphatase (YffH/AdpP family)
MLGIVHASAIADRTMAIKIVQTRTAHSGWSKLLVATVALPTGHTVTREIEDHGSAACVLPYDPARRTALLVRQFRAPVFFAAAEEDTLEAIAGLVEEADPAETARREAREEAGIELRNFEHVATAWTMPGLSTERMHFYFSQYDSGATRADKGGVAAEHEQIAVVERPLSELAAMADHNQLADVKTLLLVQTLRLRRPTLFAPS